VQVKWTGYDQYLALFRKT